MIQKYSLNSIDTTDGTNTVIHKIYNKKSKDKYYCYKNAL